MPMTAAIVAKALISTVRSTMILYSLLRLGCCKAADPASSTIIKTFWSSIFQWNSGKSTQLTLYCSQLILYCRALLDGSRDTRHEVEPTCIFHCCRTEDTELPWLTLIPNNGMLVCCSSYHKGHQQQWCQPKAKSYPSEGIVASHEMLQMLWHLHRLSDSIEAMHSASRLKKKAVSGLDCKRTAHLNLSCKALKAILRLDLWWQKGLGNILASLICLKN